MIVEALVALAVGLVVLSILLRGVAIVGVVLVVFGRLVALIRASL